MLNTAPACVFNHGEVWASYTLWAVLRSMDSTVEALESHRRFYTSPSPLTNLWKHCEFNPKQKKMTVAQLPKHICLAGTLMHLSLWTAWGFSNERPLCVCKLLSCWVIFFNNCFLALHYCTMKILLHYTFFRESATLHSPCRVGLLRANFQSHAFYGKCTLNHAASH